MQNYFYRLETLSPTDRSLFNHFGRGQSIWPPFSLIHQAFENVVDTQPQSMAVDHDGRSMTYRELEEAANILASRLMLQGLRHQQRVCLVVQRSSFMTIAILAVLKCGCQYVPLGGG
jgi:non-ribosomal peptide synthetase component F